MFTLVPKEDFGTVRENLHKRLPRSAQLYNVVQLMISEAYPAEILSKLYLFTGSKDLNPGQLNETENLDDLFAVAVQFREAYSDYAVILSSPDSCTDKMISAFENLVDWRRPVCFCAVDVCVSSIVADLCRKNGKLGGVDPCDMMTMSIESAQAVQVVNPHPDAIVRELDPSDAELVTKRWNFAQEGTESLMKLMIKHIGSAGVYVKEKLVCWIVIFAIGSMNALYTEDEFRKRGYARLTMQKICKTAGEKLLVPNVQVVDGNFPSVRLMESVGFKFSHKVEWVIYNGR